MLTRPVIYVVDDEPEALSGLLDALARRYGGDYRVMSQLSGSAAVADLQRLKDDGEQVALVIADQWMPEMEGIELLDRAHRLFPDAQRALLVGWGDRTAATTIIEGCAFGHIENYIYKPWAPAEVHLYPYVGEFLAEWARLYVPGMELLQIIGSEPSPRDHQLRDLLSRNGIPHGYYLADSEAGRRLLERALLDGSQLPVVMLLDGHALIDPTNSELLDALGASTTATTADVVIVGGGPGGLAAAVYAASEGLNTLVVEREAVGGQASTSSLIRNYLGFPRGISGAELARRSYEQSWVFGAKYVFAREAQELRAEGLDRVVKLSDGRELRARAVIIATGATYRRVGIPSLERFSGAGLYYTVPADGSFMRGKDAIVVGGGNSAGQAVTHLAKHARRVLVLVRGASIRDSMSEYLVQLIEHKPNVEVRYHTELVEGNGDAALREVVVRDRQTGALETLRDHTLFVLIGAYPHTEWLAGAVQRDEHGFICTGADAIGAGQVRRGIADRLETSLPGVFAIGDVRHGSVKRVASAAGEGAMVVAGVHGYLAAPVAWGLADAVSG
jgi:thioredoxin reductase (NADPH)